MATTATFPTFPMMPSSVAPLGAIFTLDPTMAVTGGVWLPPPLPPVSMLRTSTQTMTVDSNGNDAVWPPPPLPPISSDIAARLEMLEKHRIVSMDMVREKEIEFEAVESEWKAKVELLEAKLRAEASSASRRAEEAARDAEARVREETRLEVQLLRLNFQDESERLRVELRQAETQRNEFRMELDKERTNCRRQLMQKDASIEDLQRQLAAITKERDTLSTDYVHLKNVIAEREKESKMLRDAMEEERQHGRILKSERDTAKADLEATKARAKLDSSGQMMRDSFSSPRISITTQQQQQVINVDLTGGEDDDGPLPGQPFLGPGTLMKSTYVSLVDDDSNDDE